LGSVGFSIHLLEKAGVAVSPGVGFGESGEGFVRFALVEDLDRIGEAISRIGGIL
jgi:alanine-synthesizing transaminase